MIDDNGMPEFLNDNELPPGLKDNPSKALGIKFKKKPGFFGIQSQYIPKAQRVMNVKENKRVIIRGLDNKPIKLDLDSAERLNVYSTKTFTLSDDESYVTDKKTGEVYQLNCFYTSNEDHQISWSTDEDGNISNVHVIPKLAKGEELTHNTLGGQTFQAFPGYDDNNIVVGYLDEELDTPIQSFEGDMYSDEDERVLEEIAPTQPLVAMNCGGNSYTDVDGVVYAEDIDYLV